MWQIIDRRILVDAPLWLRVGLEDLKLPDGTTVSGFTALDMPPYVVVAALAPDEQVVVIRSYKHGPH